MFAFRQNLRYHGFQAAREVWTPAVGYFLTERELSRHVHGTVYPSLYLFIIIYTSLDIKYTKAEQVEVTALRAEENTCFSLLLPSFLLKMTPGTEIQLNCSKSQIKAVFIGKPAT